MTVQSKSEINIHYRYLSALSSVVLEKVCHLGKEDYIKFYTEELRKRRELGKIVYEARIYKLSIMMDSKIADELVKFPEFAPSNLLIRYLNWPSF